MTPRPGDHFPGNDSGTSDAAAFGEPCEAARAATARLAAGAEVAQPAAADSMRRRMVWCCWQPDAATSLYSIILHACEVRTRRTRKLINPTHPTRKQSLDFLSRQSS
jgi:hypothetical protein